MTARHNRSRRPIIGGNWKMNTTLSQAIDLAEALVRRLGEVTDTQIVLFPPFPNLEAVHQSIAGSPLELGGQDLFWADSGAYTGEVSAPMLLAVGCGWALVGHSERRHGLGESSEVVNRKLQAALRNGLEVILAIGETRDEREEGRTDEVLRDQLHRSLDDVTAADMARVVVAYEPVWAIGTGATATPEQARDAHEHVRSVLRRLYSSEIAEGVRIQYGGSVSADNARELLSEPGIDGALVGGASLKPDDFATIVRASLDILG